MKFDVFSQLLTTLNIPLEQRQYDLFEAYYQLLITWNKQMNLTSIVERDEVFLKHFYDSLTLIKAFTHHEVSLLDVGSGAGFPSIPLKIMYPSTRITIVESSSKRIRFLKALTEALALDVELVENRIEAFNQRETYDITTARAVASLNMLSELCIPFVKVGGLFLAPKGKGYQEELDGSRKALARLGAKHLKTIPVNYGQYNRVILVIEKFEETPIKYPRNFARIKKNPL